MRSSKYICIGLLLAMTATCSDWEPVTCESGIKCPIGHHCSADGKFCITGLCGNGIIDINHLVREMCDDGNVVSGDGCSANCLSDETCGNGYKDEDEICDYEIAVQCNKDCKSTMACGDGRVGSDEECDDSNTTPGDGCNSMCQIESCGNGVKDTGEACDTNATDGYCSKDCSSDGSCGNGIRDPDEACDDGNTVSGDGCRDDCSSTEICGNGIHDVHVGEDCDCGTDVMRSPLACNGSINNDIEGYCRRDCRLHCGDGSVSRGEGCDGNSAPPHFCAEKDGYDMGFTTECTSCQIVWENQCKKFTTQGSSSPPYTTAFKEVFGIDLVNIFAVGDGGMIIRFDGDVWQPENRPSQPQFTIFDIWGDRTDNMFAVGGNGTILRREEGAGDAPPHWEPEQPPTSNDLHGIWGMGGRIFAVGASGTILQRQSDGDWEPISPPPPPVNMDLYAVWGSGNDIFVVGASGTILRGDGNTWQIVSPILTTMDLHGIWGTGNEIFVVGDAGSILRIDIRTNDWEYMITPGETSLHAVWGTSSEDITAVGDGGTVLHYDGNDDNLWAPVRSSANANLQGVWSVERNPPGPAAPEVVSVVIGDSSEGYRFSYERVYASNSGR
jgi:cysteine-rich repeat protein